MLLTWSLFKHKFRWVIRSIASLPVYLHFLPRLLLCMIFFFFSYQYYFFFFLVVCERALINSLFQPHSLRYGIPNHPRSSPAKHIMNYPQAASSRKDHHPSRFSSIWNHWKAITFYILLNLYKSLEMDTVQPDGWHAWKPSKLAQVQI